MAEGIFSGGEVRKPPDTAVAHVFGDFNGFYVPFGEMRIKWVKRIKGANTDATEDFPKKGRPQRPPFHSK